MKTTLNLDDELLTQAKQQAAAAGTSLRACHFRSAVEAGKARGNLVFDAQIAAVCEEHGVLDLVTGDRDFSRFSALRPQSL